MAIKGSLKEASLPDVLQLLALGQKTGCLSIADRSNFGYIYFDRGRICYASIVNRRDRLGDILVKHEKITQDQLDAAIHRQAKERDKKLGEILVMQNVLTQQELERYMRMQIEESVYYLFTWTQGTFNFEADVRPEQQDFLVSINPESLLLEGARRVDEWGLIEKKIPSFDLIFAVDRDRLAISDAKLTEIQDRLLPLLDGSRDVNQVIEDSGLGEFEVGKALYGLVTAGFLHRAGRTASAEDVKMTDARVEEHRNLGIAFYKTGMLDEAAREFRRVAELRATDANAHFYIGLVALKQARWREAMEALRLAAEKGGSRPAVLHNLGLAYEQLGRLEDAEAAYSEAATRARTDPRVYVGWGIVALKQGRPSGSGPGRSPPRPRGTSRSRSRSPYRPSRRIRSTACCATISPCCTSWRARCRKPRSWRAPRSRTSRPCRSCPRISATSPTVAPATMKRGRCISGRSSCPLSWAMTSTSSSATSRTSETTATGRASCGGARSS